MAVDTTNMEGLERLFWENMNGIGASMEAYKRTSPRDWYPDKMVYRITRANETQAIGELPWDLDMYANLFKIAKGEA